MTSSGNKSAQLCTPKAKVMYPGLYAYLNGFVEACVVPKLFSLDTSGEVSRNVHVSDSNTSTSDMFDVDCFPQCRVFIV